MEVSDLGQCPVVFHISQQACVYMTGVHGVTSDDLQHVRHEPEARQPHAHFISSKLIQQHRQTMQTLQVNKMMF